MTSPYEPEPHEWVLHLALMIGGAVLMYGNGKWLWDELMAPPRYVNQEGEYLPRTASEETSRNDAMLTPGG